MPTYKDSKNFGYKKDYFVYLAGLKIQAVEVLGDTRIASFNDVINYIANDIGGKAWQGTHCWNVATPIEAVEKVLKEIGHSQTTKGILKIGAKYEGIDGSVTWQGNDKINSNRRPQKTRSGILALRCAVKKSTLG